MRTVTLSGTSNSGTILSVGTPDSSTGRRSKSTTSTWNSRSQRELTVNQLSGKLGADQFGLDDTTAIRYATIARQLLETPPGSTIHASCREPRDQNSPQATTTLEFPLKTLGFAGTLGKGRGPLRTVRATCRGTRLKQAARALQVEVRVSCAGGPGAPAGRMRARGGSGLRRLGLVCRG